MAHKVICSVCGKQFDRDVIQAVKSGARRYAHYKCKPDGEIVPLPAKAEDKDLTALKEYIIKIYGDKANWALINKQIKDFQKDYEYSLTGILKSLVYFYEIKHNPIDQSKGGIGIVPFVYKDAYNYYYNLFVAQSQNEDKDIQEMTSKVREITIKAPERPVKKRFFKFLDEDEVE